MNLSFLAEMTEMKPIYDFVLYIVRGERIAHNLWKSPTRTLPGPNPKEFYKPMSAPGLTIVSGPRFIFRGNAVFVTIFRYSVQVL